MTQLLKWSRTLFEAAGGVIQQLRGLAVPFLERDGRLILTKLPGHSYPRGARVPGGGPCMMSALGPRLLKEEIRLLEDAALIRLLRDARGRIVGADLVHEPGNKLFRVRARATVLAMGSLGEMYPVTTNAPGVAGVGYAAALEAGARLRDMEFVQFTPTAMAHPPGAQGEKLGRNRTFVQGSPYHERPRRAIHVALRSRCHGARQARCPGAGHAPRDCRGPGYAERRYLPRPDPCTDGRARDEIDLVRPPPGLLARHTEARHMCLTAEAMLTAMRMREESRGAHFRSDFPNRNDKKWLQNIFLSLGSNGEIRAETVSVNREVKEYAEKGV